MKSAAFAILALLLAACEVASLKLLTKEEQANLRDVDAIAVLPQAEIDIRVSRASSDYEIQMERLSLIATPINQVVLARDFGTDLIAALKDKLERLDKVSVRVRRDAITAQPPQAKLAALNQSSASAVLIIEVTYWIDRDVLAFEAEAGLFPKTERLRNARARPDPANPLAPGNALFRQSFRYNTTLVGIEYSSKQRIGAAFIEAANNLAAQLATTLNHGI